MSDVWDPAANEILVRASELASSEQRAAYLDEVCAGNPEQRERVERLLLALQNAGSFLEGPPDQLTRAQVESDDDPDQRIGTQIGPYEVLQQIGEGGFGVVYMAEQQRPVRRKVALKIIKPGMDSQQVIARFEAEQQALALMDHVNIARVLDAGTTDSGRPYFAMELVKGVPITEFCDKNKSSLTERLALFVTVCRAVQHAHQKGVIHRDIKPSNIMVTLHDGKPVPKVIDFGVAKAISQSLTEQKLFTHYGQMIGTPQYMSPEQAEMSGLEVDTRSDIYSLGVLLYELLTATTPVTAEQLRVAGLGEIQRVIREEESPTPSTRLSTLGDRLTIIASHRQSDASKLSQLLRGELDWIVMKSLDKDRARRYETASAFASDVEAYLHDEPVLARPPSVGYLLGKAIRKYRVLVATTAAIAIILVAATAISGWLAVRASFAEIRADQQRDLATENANEARKLAKDASDKAKLLLAAEQRLSETVKAKSDQLYASNMNVASQAYAEGNLGLMYRKLDEHEPGSSKPDQRGIEWYQLWQAGHLNAAFIRNPSTGPFHYLAVSPDATKVAVSGYPNSVYIFDCDRFVSLRSPIRLSSSGVSHTSGHSETLCFSPGGDFLVIATVGSPTIRVYETTNWRLVATLAAENVLTVAFAKDKPLMAAGSSNDIRLWDTSNWEELHPLSSAGRVSNMAFSPDASKIIAMLGDVGEGTAKVAVWNVDELNGQVSIQFARTLFEDQDVRSIALSPKGRKFAVAGNDNSVRVWDSADLFDAETEPTPVKLTGTAPIGNLSFSPDEVRLLGKQGSDNTVVVWNVDGPDGRPLFIQGHGREIWGVNFVEDANRIWTSGDDGFVKVWDLNDCQPYYSVDNVSKDSPVRYRDSETLVYLDVLGKLRSWSISTRKTKELDGERAYRHIALSDDGCFAAGMVKGGGLRVWNLADNGQAEMIDLDDRRELRTWGFHNGQIIDVELHDHDAIRLAVSNDGRRVSCLLGWPGSFAHAFVFDVKTRKLLGPQISNAVGVVSPVFSPSGNELVVTRWLSSQRPTSLFNVGPEGFKAKYSVQGWGIDYCAAFSTDGALLAIGGTGNNIRLYNSISGHQKQMLRGHTGELRSLTFAQDNSRLISGGLDGTVRIWKEGQDEDGRSDWRLVSTLKCNSSAINSVAVAPDGTSIAAVGHDDQMQVWRIASNEKTRNSVARQLTRASDHIAGNEFAEALHELEDFERSPNSLDVLQLFQLRALLFDRQGDWNSAIEEWTKAITLVPDNAYFLESRAKAYSQANQLAESTKDLHRLVQLTNEMNAEYLFALGKNQALMGQASEAKANLLKVLKLDSRAETIRNIHSVCRLGKSIVPRGTNWKYIRTFGTAPANWNTTTLDDSNWESGTAPFGTALKSRTNWQIEPDIWLRKTFRMQEPLEEPLTFHMWVNDEAEIYLNGILAAKVGSNLEDNRATVECLSDARLQPGENLLAIHCRRLGGADSVIDAGLNVQADSAEIIAALIESLKPLPNAKGLYAWLSDDLAMHRQWKEAAACYGELLELSPPQHAQLEGLRAAVSNVYVGNLNRYDQIRGEMLTRFAETNNAAIAEKIAKACLLTRPQESDMAAIDELIDTSLTSRQGVWTGIIAFAQANKTLFEYRRNEDKEAIKWAKKSRESFAGAVKPGSMAEPLFRCVTCLEALAHVRLGDRDSAIKEVEDFKQFVLERSPLRPGSQFTKNYKYNWQDWILCEILVREIDQEMPEKED